MVIPLVWIALAIVVAATSATELVPERFLRPRDFNHHPFTDVGSSPAQRPTARRPDTHPYAILSSKRQREGRQFPDQDVVLYPNPPADVLPRKQLHQQVQIQHLQPIQQIEVETGPVQIQPAHPVQPASYAPYNEVLKNYAFSYSVKDQHSGDDFSHSQAHNGKATRGQYRVKLPDGRVQVVSYTADHKGYRADVQYEGEASKTFQAYPRPTPIYESHPQQQEQQQYVHEQPRYTPTQAPYVHTPTPIYEAHPQQPEQQQYIQEQPRYTPTPTPYVHTPTPTPYEQPVYSPTPSAYIQEQSYSPTPATYNAQQYPHGYARPTPNYANEQIYVSPSRPQFEGQYVPATPTTFQQQYEAPSPSPYPANEYISPTPESYQGGPSGFQSSPAPYSHQQYESPAGSEYSGTPSPFAVEPHLRSTPAPFAQQHFESSTEAPSGRHILVTPRTLFNAALARRGFSSQNSLLYKFSSPA